MIVALFDLDGTLYTGHIFRGIQRHHRLHHTKRFYVYAYMAVWMVMWPFCRLFHVSEERVRILFLRNMAWVVRGWTPQEAAKAFSWIAREYVLPLVRPNILERLRHHQNAGHRTVLVSGTFSPLLAEIGRQLGIEETVGTPLVVRNGRYVGTCEHPICQGSGKWLRLEEHLAGDDIDWERSYAYADTYWDLPLLGKVGHPVAVSPEPLLAAHAREHEWEIIESD